VLLIARDVKGCLGRHVRPKDLTVKVCGMLIPHVPSALKNVVVFSTLVLKLNNTSN
jgi:hypothetical protein